MPKVSWNATKKQAQPGRRRKVECLSELQLSREPLRIDIVVIRRSRPGTPPAPRLLASIVGDVEQLRHPLPGQKRRHMKDENKVAESFEQALKHLVARLPPEQRLAGLAPEQSGRRQPRPDVPPADKSHAGRSAFRAGRARLAPRSEGQ